MQLEQLRMQMLSLSAYHVHYFKNKIISMKFKSIRGIDWIYSNLIWSAGWTCGNLDFQLTRTIATYTNLRTQIRDQLNLKNLKDFQTMKNI